VYFSPKPNWIDVKIMNKEYKEAQRHYDREYEKKKKKTRMVMA
jgi:hypothetical protein